MQMRDVGGARCSRAAAPLARKRIKPRIVRNLRISERERLSYWTLPGCGWSREIGPRVTCYRATPENIAVTTAVPVKADGLDPVASDGTPLFRWFGTGNQVGVLPEDAVVLNALDAGLPGPCDRLVVNHTVLEP